MTNPKPPPLDAAELDAIEVRWMFCTAQNETVRRDVPVLIDSLRQAWAEIERLRAKEKAYIMPSGEVWPR